MTKKEKFEYINNKIPFLKEKIIIAKKEFRKVKKDTLSYTKDKIKEYKNLKKYSSLKIEFYEGYCLDIEIDKFDTHLIITDFIPHNIIAIDDSNLEFRGAEYTTKNRYKFDEFCEFVIEIRDFMNSFDRTFMKKVNEAGDLLIDIEFLIEEFENLVFNENNIEIDFEEFSKEFKRIEKQLKELK